MPGKSKPQRNPTPHPLEPDPQYGHDEQPWTGPSPPDSQRPGRKRRAQDLNGAAS
jgi:hypothetical protein